MCDLVRPYTQKNPWSALCEPSEKAETKKATVVLGASHSTSCRGYGNTCRCHWNTRRFHGKTHRSLGNTLLRDSSPVLVRRVPSIHTQQTIEIVGSVGMFSESVRFLENMMFREMLNFSLKAPRNLPKCSHVRRKCWISGKNRC